MSFWYLSVVATWWMYHTRTGFFMFDLLLFFYATVLVLWKAELSQTCLATSHVLQACPKAWDCNLMVVVGYVWCDFFPSFENFQRAFFSKSLLYGMGLLFNKVRAVSCGCFIGTRFAKSALSSYLYVESFNFVRRVHFWKVNMGWMTMQY